MAKIFLSYSSRDADTVRKIVDDLHAVGNKVWYDKTLTGGQSWWDKILSNIRDCDIFIFIISKDSLVSEACKSELSYVVPLGIGVLPVVIDKSVNINLLPQPLSEIQVADYNEQDKQSVLALIKSIAGIPVKSSLPEPLPVPPPVPVSYLNSLKEKIESKNKLDSDAQISLVFELRKCLRKERSRKEVIDLLNCLKQRDELLAKVSTDIEEALSNFENNETRHASVTPMEKSDRVNKENSETNLDNTNHRKDKPVNSTTSKTCIKCAHQNRSDATFCSHCGAEFAPVSKQELPVPAPQTSPPQDMKIRRFTYSPNQYQQLIAQVEVWLRSMDFECQRLSVENNGVLLQIKKKGTWRNLVGMSTALNISFKQSDNDNLQVEIGTGKWMDKAIVGTVSFFVLWPLAVTAGIGAWQQSKMPDQIFDFIGNCLSSY